jgi:hypothetical protein
MPSLLATFNEPTKKITRPDEEKLGTAPGDYIVALYEIFLLVDKGVTDNSTGKPLVKAIIFKFIVLTSKPNSKKEAHATGMIVGKYIDANPAPAQLQSNRKAITNIVGTLLYAGEDEFTIPDLNNEHVRNDLLGTVIKVTVPAEENKNAKGEPSGWHYVNFKELANPYNIRTNPQAFIDYLTMMNRPEMVELVNRVLEMKPFDKKTEEIEHAEDDISSKGTASTSSKDDDL